MRKAFTLTELLIGILIMVITAGVLTLNTGKMGHQTAKREAERVAAYILACMRKADIRQDTFWITITNEGIELKAGEFINYNAYTTAKLVDDPPFTMSKGSTFKNNARLVYPSTKERSIGTLTFKPIASGTSVNTSEGTGSQYCLTINGYDGETYNVLIGVQ